jgi:beta-lactamase regulating signal transducer with metallopeptidase domain
MYLPPAAAAVLWLTGPRLGRWLPPATAGRLLTVAALVTALANGFVLAAAGFVVLAQAPPVAALGRWSAVALRAGDPVPVAAGVLAAAASSALLASAVRRAAQAGQDLARAALLCRRLRSSAGGLVIVEDDVADAYALPGISGRVVVSTAMLRALPADERRVLLAHEVAHLKHHHHLYIQLVELAAAANPLLRPVARAVRAAVERWADEVAAAEVGDRRLAARALARAGLARAAGTGGDRRAPAAALGALEDGVAARARALLVAPPRPRYELVGAVVALLLATTVATAHTAQVTEHRFDRAQAAYTATR